MKFNLKSLLIVFSLFYFVYDPLRDILTQREVHSFLQNFTDLAAFAGLMTNLISFLGFALGAYWIFYKKYEPKKKWMALSLLIPLIFTCIGFRYLTQEVLGQLIFGVSNYNANTTLVYYFFDNLYYAIIYISLGIVFFFIQYAQYKEVQQRELILQNQKTELAFLRSQLNPHFLFNILNNIYSLVYYKSDNALKSVEKLSSLLRYALYEKSEKVLVKKEVKNLFDFIDLHRMRFDYDLDLNIQISEATKTLQIAPFILIPFVENAFKHGNLKNPKQATSIRLNIKDNYLIYQVSNEKVDQEKDKVGGIGVQNIQKRLELIYGDKANLDIQENANEYSITLRIDRDAC